MRITNSMLVSTFLGDMNNNLENLRTIQNQLSTGKKISKPSDDPSGTVKSMQLNQDLDMNTQYATNIKNCSEWLQQTDTALGQAGDSLQRISELLVSGGNGTYGKDQRQSILAEINQIVDQFSDIVNSSFSGVYLFGGIRGNERPLGTIDTASGNCELVYNNQSFDIPVSSGTGTTMDIASSCGGMDIQIGGGSLLHLDINSGSSISSNIATLNSQIASDPNLKGKVTLSSYTKGDQTYVKVQALSTEDITLNNTTIAGLSDFSGKYIGVNKVDMISKKLNVEISQGVTSDYNVSASQIINYSAVSSSGMVQSYDLRQVFKDVVNHLASSSGTSNITTKDIDGIKGALDNILKLRSGVGARENRMTTALKNNSENKYNMTDVLTHTEDIDLAETTMNFYTLQTVYLSAMHTSAKILQPTLIDYM